MGDLFPFTTPAQLLITHSFHTIPSFGILFQKNIKLATCLHLKTQLKRFSNPQNTNKFLQIRQMREIDCYGACRFLFLSVFVFVCVLWLLAAIILYKQDKFISKNKYVRHHTYQRGPAHSLGYCYIAIQKPCSSLDLISFMLIREETVIKAQLEFQILSI